MPALLALGFASGLPLALTLGTLSVWLTESGISKTQIGLFGAIGIAYSFKFAWSPLIDHTRLPVLGRLLGQRRSWMLLTQCLLALSIVFMGTLDPAETPWLVALAAALVAFASATQDIIIDAYRVEKLTPERQGTGSAVAVLGYRLGQVASGAGALYLSMLVGWHITYFCMAPLIGIGTLAMLLSGEPQHPPLNRPKHLSAWFGEPLRDFMTRTDWPLILAFVTFYKLPDAFIGIMGNRYYLETGFTKDQIAYAGKIYGMLASIAGGFLGAYLIRRRGLLATLWIGGIACGLGALLFIPLQQMNGSVALLAAILTLDNISGGISITAQVAYLSRLCNARFTATQYALLSSLTGVARSLSSTPSGWVSQTYGWTSFFIVCASLSLPGLALLAVLTKRQSPRNA